MAVVPVAGELKFHQVLSEPLRPLKRDNRPQRQEAGSFLTQHLPPVGPETGEVLVQIGKPSLEHRIRAYQDRRETELAQDLVQLPVGDVVPNMDELHYGQSQFGR
ncbi:hypothetical protein ACJBCE_00370 [Streptomyces sp. NBUL23]|uniref:hypothetical protein n=1 Tax=Streptomyces sp. NBUL23 TaxID=3381354 RepID=UPI0038720D3C